MVGPPFQPVIGPSGMFMSTSTPVERNPPPSSPPEAWGPLVRFARLAGRPLDRFLRIEAASGILLLVAAAIALVGSLVGFATVRKQPHHFESDAAPADRADEAVPAELVEY